MRKGVSIAIAIILGLVTLTTGAALAVAATLVNRARLGTAAGGGEATSSGWISTGNMSVARMSFSMTTLVDGRVLAAGGRDGAGHQLASAELYDPATGTWSSTGAMRQPREGHTSTLLPNGLVLVAGGQNAVSGELPTAELYNPASGKWRPTGHMAQERACHGAALIPAGPMAGRVLVFGDSCGGVPRATAELFDPRTGTWTSTGSMSIARYVPGHAALRDGRIVVVGGGTCCPYGEVNEAEIFDPGTGTWTPTTSKTTPAEDQATLLPDGRVLAAGGWKGTQPFNQVVRAAEVFDPSTGIWSAVERMSVGRSAMTLTLLSSGQVLAAGGNNGGWGVCNVQRSTETYHPRSGAWRAAGDMAFPRAGHQAVLLADGSVLAAGGVGSDCSSPLSSAELYVP